MCFAKVSEFKLTKALRPILVATFNAKFKRNVNWLARLGRRDSFCHLYLQQFV